MASKEDCLSAFARLPSGVVIITGFRQDQRPCGATIGSFSSLSLDPPMAIFAMFKDSQTLAAIRESGRFAVHVVEHSNRETARHFASRTADKFCGDLGWRTSLDGLPMLEGFNTRLSCRLVDLREAGDHEIVTCAIENVDLNDVDCTPAAWFMRDFHELQLPTSFRN